MRKVITFSTKFPSYHPKAGQPTFFVEKFWNSVVDNMSYYEVCRLNDHLNEECKKLLWDFWMSIKKNDEMSDTKYHTIRAGHRFKVGDKFSPRVWGNNINPKSGRSGPYQSKQIIIAPDIRIEKTWDFGILRTNTGVEFYLNKKLVDVTSSIHWGKTIADNDGLDADEFIDWFILSTDFKKTKFFDGQIICWNENINY